MENITTSPETGSGMFAVTRQMVHDRTLELALIDGRLSHQIKQADYERAKRELTGETDFDLQQKIMGFHEC